VFEKLFEKRKKRQEAVTEARQDFSSWLEISQSEGWKAYCEKIDKKIDNIKNKIDNDLVLTGEDLKRLQLALQVWKEVKRVPKELEENAKGGK
jgi:hypothetical protein